MNRRRMLQSLASALVAGPLGAVGASAEVKPPRKLLFFSRSVLFEHPVIRREGGRLSFAEQTLSALARKIGCTVECTKDGRVFDRSLDDYAAVVSYTCGKPEDLRKAIPADGQDGNHPLSESGWKKLDAAVRAGKPFVAIHPGLWLLPEACGADCLGHGSQQTARMIVASPKFPGAEKLGESFTMHEEWFSLMRFANDLHVILVQDCGGMNKQAELDRRCYDRPPFPATWARTHGKGRVFYTSMGHREDVWTSKPFEQVVLGGIAWALGQVDADLTPNLQRVAPRANEFMKP